MSRANGWYFVRIDDEWRPAEWFDGDWDLSPMMALLILEVDEDPISIAIHAENRQLRAKVAELEAQAAIGRRAVEMLLALVDELDCLIGESGGVYGLHLNGDPSPWSEILQGGRFERLCSLDDARLFVTEQAAPELSTVATDGLWQPASADDGMRNIDISDVCGGQTDCEPATVAVDATPFAWAMFDGEGGHILMLYEGNETLQDDWNAAHPNGYPNWITPLYEAPPVTPNSSIVAVDAGRGPYGGRLTGDSVAQDPSTAPEAPATVAVNAVALEALRSAMSKLRAPMPRTAYGAARACIIEAARRLLAGGE